MLRLAIEDHFAHVASACSQPCVYSLDLSSDPTGGAPALAALDAAFEGQGVAGVARATDGPRLMSDVEDVAEEPKLYFQDAEIVHFQVVHASPGNMHTVPMPRAAGTRLTPSPSTRSLRMVMASDTLLSSLSDRAKPLLQSCQDSLPVSWMFCRKPSLSFRWGLCHITSKASRLKAVLAVQKFRSLCVVLPSQPVMDVAKFPSKMVVSPGSGKSLKRRASLSVCQKTKTT